LVEIQVPAAEPVGLELMTVTPPQSAGARYPLFFDGAI
jgi:hypothetical protein